MSLKIVFVETKIAQNDFLNMGKIKKNRYKMGALEV